MPATARMALTRSAQAAGQAGVDAPSSQTGRLWANVLQEVPLFAGVSARQVRKIAALGSAARFEPKMPIVEAGDPGDAFYVILSGRAEIRRGRGKAAEEIGPGAYFGEMALIDGVRRSATVVATRETVCLMLPRKAFVKVLKAEPGVALALLGTLAARVRELEASPAG
jgi:CRP-like cAMP-binding protein